jgi:hypothetical protein
LNKRDGQWSHRLPAAEEAASKPLADERASEWVSTSNKTFTSSVPSGLRAEVAAWVACFRQGSSITMSNNEVGSALDLGRLFGRFLSLEDIYPRENLYQGKFNNIKCDLDFVIAATLAFPIKELFRILRPLPPYSVLDSLLAESLMTGIRPVLEGTFGRRNLTRDYYNLCSVPIRLVQVLPHRLEESDYSHSLSLEEFSETTRVIISLSEKSKQFNVSTSASILQTIERTLRATNEFSFRREYRLFFLQLLDFLLDFFHGDYPKFVEKFYHMTGWLTDHVMDFPVLPRYSAAGLRALFRLSGVNRVRAQRLLLRVIQAREGGALPAWEAIRVVRERFEIIDAEFRVVAVHGIRRASL